MTATVTPIRKATTPDGVHELFVQDRNELKALLIFLLELRDLHHQDRLTGFVNDHEVDGMDRAIRALETLTGDLPQTDPKGFIAQIAKLYQALAYVVDTVHALDGTEPKEYASSGDTVPSGRLMRAIRAEHDSMTAASVRELTELAHAAFARTLNEQS